MAVGWDRLRLESELEREIDATELICGKAWVAREQPPRACRAYLSFLKRAREWLQCGVAPRHARRDTRQLLHALATSLASRGQVDAFAVKNVEPRPPRRRNR